MAKVVAAIEASPVVQEVVICEATQATPDFASGRHTDSAAQQGACNGPHECAGWPSHSASSQADTRASPGTGNTADATRYCTDSATGGAAGVFGFREKRFAFGAFDFGHDDFRFENEEDRFAKVCSQKAQVRLLVINLDRESFRGIKKGPS